MPDWQAGRNTESFELDYNCTVAETGVTVFNERDLWFTYTTPDDISHGNASVPVRRRMPKTVRVELITPA